MAPLVTAGGLVVEARRSDGGSGRAGRVARRVVRTGAGVARRLAWLAWRLARRVARRSARVVRRAAWGLLRGLFALLGLRVAVELVGVPVVATVGGLGLVGWLLGRWVAVVEPWLFAPRPATRPRVLNPAAGAGRARPLPPSDGSDHLAFARALALVADRYVAECERQAAARRVEDGDGR
jgi:hypothetical protein